MALQEIIQLEDVRDAERQRESREKLTGEATEPAPPDYGFRDAWRWPLFGLVVLAGVTGCMMAIRVARARRWRAVSGRLLGLLLLGMGLIDVAFLLDVLVATDVPHLVRSWTVVWLYPLGALLAAGSLYRLTELEAQFGDDVAPPPLLSAIDAARAERGEWRD